MLTVGFVNHALCMLYKIINLGPIIVTHKACSITSRLIQWWSTGQSQYSFGWNGKIRFEEEYFHPNHLSWRVLQIRDDREGHRCIRIYGTPALPTLNALVDVFCLRGDIKRAEQLFGRMVKVRIKSNAITYTCLINGHCMNRDIEKFHIVFFKADSRGTFT